MYSWRSGFGDIFYSDGTHEQIGRIHRDNGPAVIWVNGNKSWYQHGKLHRLDGPAIERVNGKCSWYVDNIRIDCTSQEEFEQLLRLKAFW
jgi:hypothetical protein